LPVLADAGYGDSRDFREGLRKRELKYSLGISSQTSVWKPGTQVKVQNKKGRSAGRPRTRANATDGSKPVRVHVLAQELWDAGSFRNICWRMNSKGPLEADLTVLRVQSAKRRTKKMPPGQEEWLIIEHEKSGDFKYYLSSMSARSTFKSRVRLAKMRWHVERDY